MNKEFPFRKFTVESQVIECEVPCDTCEFKSNCKNSDSEVLKYEIDTVTIGKEVKDSSIIFPKIESASFERAEKLLMILTQLYLYSSFNVPCNAIILSKNLKISVFKVRKRLKYLVDHNYVSLRKEGKNIFIYVHSLNRVVNNIIRYYIYEFERRFGRKPVISGYDIGIVSNLVKDYSEEEIRMLISKFFSLDDQYVAMRGYSLKTFYYQINKLLVLLSRKNKELVNSNITMEQLKEYIQGKKEGRWSGNEDWAKPYEDMIRKLNI